MATPAKPDGDRSEVVIAGGGTAGHTNPGIAIAQALVRAGIAHERIRFIGGERGNESTLVPEAGFAIVVLPGRGIPRTVSVAAVRAGLETVRGVVGAMRLMRQIRPRVVVCLGGYAAFGPSAAAVVLRIPVVVSEQNARASAVNRLIGRVAAVCAVPFEATDLPHAVVTGNPIRAEVVTAMQGASRSRSREVLGLPDGVDVVAAWSGSLGAASINRAVRDLACRWAERRDVVLYHVVGRRDWAEFGAVPDRVREGGLHYVTVEYEDRMPDLLAASSVAIGRAGASTVAELAVAGLPAVLVPLPGAPRDHQRANAEELAAVGGAQILDESRLDAVELERMLTPWLVDPAEREAASRSLQQVAAPAAADEVARLVIDVGRVK